MDISRLEEFIVLAECGSFRSAAEKLGLSVPLLSSRISAMEAKAGVQLIERSAHRFALTEAGKKLLSEAREISGEYRSVLESLGGRKEEERSIRIGIGGFIIPHKVGPYLDTINLLYPNIRIDVLDDRTCSIPEGLEKGVFDVFFTYCPDSRQFEGVEKEFVYSTKVQVLVPLSHHLAGKGSIDLRELDGERFVLYPANADSSIRDCEKALLDRSGISYRVYEGVVCPNAYYVMVPVGKGLALCPWVMRQMIPPNTTALSVSDTDFVFSMYMFYRKDCANPYLPEFLEGFRRFESGGMRHDN